MALSRSPSWQEPSGLGDSARPSSRFPARFLSPGPQLFVQADAGAAPGVNSLFAARRRLTHVLGPSDTARRDFSFSPFRAKHALAVPYRAVASARLALWHLSVHLINRRDALSTRSTPASAIAHAASGQSCCHTSPKVQYSLARFCRFSSCARRRLHGANSPGQPQIGSMRGLFPPGAQPIVQADLRSAHGNAANLVALPCAARRPLNSSVSPHESKAKSVARLFAVGLASPTYFVLPRAIPSLAAALPHHLPS